MSVRPAPVIAISERNSNDSDGYFQQFNKSLKLLSMAPDRRRGAHFDTYHNEFPNEAQGDYETCNRIDDAALRLAVKCSFKPANKYDNNVVLYEVVLYSNGEMSVYFDGTAYKAD